MGSCITLKAAFPIAACLSLAGVLLSVEASGQSMIQVATSTFAPGGQDLFVFDVAATRGTFPRGVSRLSGSVEWVTKDGRQMLKATERSELLITLPIEQILPQNFTIEVDLVPRDGGPERDLRLEGTRTINQDVGSAHLEVTMDPSFGSIYVVGGETNIPEFPIPDEVRAVLPESFTRVGVTVEANTIRFFINGREMLPDPQQPATKVQARFARGNVLRVTLGGVTEDNTTMPVYLARVRLATGAPVTVATALPATMLPASTTGTITPIAISPAGAVLPPRTITLSGFNAVGDFSSLTARTVTLAGFTAVGGFGTLPSRAMTLSGFTAAGMFASLAPRTVTLPGFSAAGSFGSLAPRTITIPGFTASGFGSLSPRSVTITGFNAAGLFVSLTPRTITLPGFTAVGYGSLVPRTVTLTGFTAAGEFVRLPPRTITLTGFTAVRIP